jgi:nucleotide-binding universal stress UspA family protein
MDTIVVGYDDSAAARSALAWAAQCADHAGRELVVVYVASSIAEWELAAAQVNPDPIRHEVRRLLKDEWTASLRRNGVPYRTRLRSGRVAEQLMRAAREEQATLIVIGMTAKGTLSELVRESTQHRLLHHAARPVVAVPAGWSSEPSNA